MTPNDYPAPSRELLRSAGANAYIVALAASFPCLAHKLDSNGITPATWDVDRFIAMSMPWSHGERLCALFVANVWNPGYAASNGWRFDIFEFIGTADSGNRRALVSWVAAPVWP